MSSEVVFLRGAESDLQSAFIRYEDKVEGLGREFLLTIDGSLTAVGQFPEMARVYHKTIRRLVVSRFPYGVFYAVEGQRIIVHAVLDLRQDPESIRKRLG